MAGGERRGFGRIEKREFGRYRAAYTGPDGKLYRAESTFDARDDATAWLSKRRAEITMGVWAPEVVAKAKEAPSRFFAACALAWLKDRNLKPRTRS